LTFDWRSASAADHGKAFLENSEKSGVDIRNGRRYHERRILRKNAGFMKSTIAIIIIDVIDLTMSRRLHYYGLAVS